MKSIWIAGVLLLSVACMRKSADGTYHVPTKMDQRTKQTMKKTGTELKAEAKKVGTELKRAGEKLKAESQKRH